MGESPLGELRQGSEWRHKLPLLCWPLCAPPLEWVAQLDMLFLDVLVDLLSLVHTLCCNACINY